MNTKMWTATVFAGHNGRTNESPATQMWKKEERRSVQQTQDCSPGPHTNLLQKSKLTVSIRKKVLRKRKNGHTEHCSVPGIMYIVSRLISSIVYNQYL